MKLRISQSRQLNVKLVLLHGFADSKLLQGEHLFFVITTPQISPVNAITHDLPTKEPEDSLIMGNEELSTIPEKESDEFIKSGVEDLVPIPRESEDTSGSDSVCVLPSSDEI
ncbi:hypothetical protein Tco_0218580 [Tanacetum coccineum]